LPVCAEEDVERFRTVLRHDDVVGDVVTLERAQRQRDIVRVVFHQQDLSRVHKSLQARGTRAVTE